MTPTGSTATVETIVEPQKQITLADRSVNPRAHALGALADRFEIDMRGQIGLARRAQRVGEGMSGNGLQRIAQAEMGMAVVDDQSRSFLAGAPAELERNAIVAPFKDCAFGRLAQSTRHCRLEMRQSLSRRADDVVAVGRNLDDALMPAAGLLDRLMHR